MATVTMYPPPGVLSATGIVTRTVYRVPSQQSLNQAVTVDTRDEGGLLATGWTFVGSQSNSAQVQYANGAPNGALLDPGTQRQLNLLASGLTKVRATINAAPINAQGFQYMSTPPNAMWLPKPGEPTYVAGAVASVGSTFAAMTGAVYYALNCSHAVFGSGLVSNTTLDSIAYLHNRANWTDLNQTNLYGVSGSTFGRMSCQNPAETATNTAQTLMFGIETDAPIIGINGGSSGIFQMVVDGQLAFNAAQQVAGFGVLDGGHNGSSWAMVSFGTRKTRKIIFILESGIGLAGQLSGIALGARDTVVPYDFTQNSFKGAIVGDSYLGHNPTDFGFANFGHQAFALLGCYAVVDDGVGSTGYLNATGGLPFTASGRVTALTASAPDVTVITGGTNDGAWSTTISNAILAYLQQIRAALPNTIICMMSAQNPNGRSLYANTWSANIPGLLAQISGPWVFIDNYNGVWSNSSGASGGDGTSWQTGTGNIQFTSGTGYVAGNSDFYQSADGGSVAASTSVHPTASPVVNWPVATANGTQALTSSTLTLNATASFPSQWPQTGTVLAINGSGTGVLVSYTSIVGNVLTGCSTSGSGSVASGGFVSLVSSTLPLATIALSDTSAIPASGSINVNGQTITYTGLSATSAAGGALTGCTGGTGTILNYAVAQLVGQQSGLTLWGHRLAKVMRDGINNL